MKTEIKDIFNKENRTQYFIYFLVCLCLASILFFIFLLAPGNSGKHPAKDKKTKPFEEVSLTGKGAVVFDVINNREIFSKNSDLPLPLASLTKVLTAVVTNKKLGDNQEVQITQEYLEPEGDSNLVVGDTWRAKDLRDFTLLTSSNDGALALAAVAESADFPVTKEEAENKFVREMNDAAEEMGLLNSKFFNEHGLDRETDKGGAYGSAKDMATLFEYILRSYPGILEATRYKNLQFVSSGKIYPAENTNIFVDKIPNLIASKTGFTDLAGGNLVIAFDAGLNRPIIISVLGSTEEGRFEDALELVDATMKFIINGG